MRCNQTRPRRTAGGPSTAPSPDGSGTASRYPEQARSIVEERRERNEADLRDYDVVDGGATVGWALWWHRGDQAELSDLDLEEPERAAELLPALVAVAREEGVALPGRRRRAG